MMSKITVIRSILLSFFVCVSSSLYALTFNTTKTDVTTCNGDKTASIVVNVVDAVGNCYFSLTEDFALQQTSNKFENLGAGAYTVYVKDDNGIVGPDNITISEPEIFKISEVSNTISICQNGTITIKAQGGTAPYTYSLDGFATEQVNNTFTSLSIGRYTAYVKDASGCEAQTATESIIINTLSVEPLKSKPAANVVCETDKTASVTFTVVGRTEVVAENDTARYYSVKLFDITNQHELLETDFKHSNKLHPVITKDRVEKEPVLDENGEPTFNELGEPITKNLTYKDTLWTEGCHEPTKVEELEKYNYNETMFGFDCNDKITVSGLGAGAYKIRFFKGDCEFAEEITFTVGITGSIPIVHINEVGGYCDESEHTITPTINSNPGVTKYEWTLDGEIIGNKKDLVHTFLLEENNSSLKLDITNRCGSATSNTILVQVNPRPTALLETSKDYLCKNQPTEVSITLTGEGPFTYTLPDGTEKTTEVVYSQTEIIPIKDTVFTLTALKDANCEAQIEKDVNTVETKIYPEPEYNMTITVPEPMVSGRYVKVNATDGFTSYRLLINEEEIPAKGPNNLFWAKNFPYGLSTNDFKMELTDENGCVWTLKETEIIESTIFPNIFTPNGDGVNDVFLADYDLKVYDRQGTLMYEGTEGWDGTHNGVEANPGVYLYTLFIPTEDGNLEVIKSTLTLER
jgi:gliding motility-associated-like protein